MKIVCSACLLGTDCKYNGGNNYSEKLVSFITEQGAQVIPVCPEVMGGLPTPRVPSEIRDGRVYNRNGEDVHEAFTAGAQQALQVVKDENPDRIILQSRSPSCGCKEVYDGTFCGKRVKGQGIFAQVLLKEGYQPDDIEDLEEVV